MKRQITSSIQTDDNQNLRKLTQANETLSGIIRAIEQGTLDANDSRLDHYANYLNTTFIPELLDSIDAHSDDSPIKLL